MPVEPSASWRDMRAAMWLSQLLAWKISVWCLWRFVYASCSCPEVIGAAVIISCAIKAERSVSACLVLSASALALFSSASS